MGEGKNLQDRPSVHKSQGDGSSLTEPELPDGREGAHTHSHAEPSKQECPAAGLGAVEHQFTSLWKRVCLFALLNMCPTLEKQNIYGKLFQLRSATWKKPNQTKKNP